MEKKETNEPTETIPSGKKRKRDVITDDAVIETKENKTFKKSMIAVESTVNSTERKQNIKEYILNSIREAFFVYQPAFEFPQEGKNLTCQGHFRSLDVINTPIHVIGLVVKELMMTLGHCLAYQNAKSKKHHGFTNVSVTFQNEGFYLKYAFQPFPIEDPSRWDIHQSFDWSRPSRPFNVDGVKKIQHETGIIDLPRLWKCTCSDAMSIIKHQREFAWSQVRLLYIANRKAQSSSLCYISILPIETIELICDFFFPRDFYAKLKCLSCKCKCKPLEWILCSSCLESKFKKEPRASCGNCEALKDEKKGDLLEKKEVYEIPIGLDKENIEYCYACKQHVQTHLDRLKHVGYDVFNNREVFFKYQRPPHPWDPPLRH